MAKTRVAGRIDRDSTWLAAGVLLWCITFVVVSVLVLRGGTYNSITYDVYVTAARHWWSHAPLYDTRSVDEFQYLPHAALLVSPFVYLGTPIGELAWRGLCWGLFGYGLWRMAAQLMPAQRGKAFLLAAALVIPTSVNSLGIGQSNLLIGASTLFVAADLVEHRYWRATGWLMFGLAAKPLMAVLLLLAWALYRPMSWRVPLGLCVLFALPFLASDPGYVWAQYSNFVAKSRVTANPNRLFEDANGLLATLGWAIPYGAFLWVRVFAAIGALAMSMLAKRRFPDPLGTMYVAGIAVAYLMLFNPRTQSNSYLIPASVAALLATTHLLERRWLAATGMLVVIVGWYGNSHHMQWPEYWLKPLACVGFTALLLWELTAKPTTPLPLAEPTRRRDRPPSRRTSRDRPLEK